MEGIHPNVTVGSKDITKIEADMNTLETLFQDFTQAVHAQEPVIEKLEHTIEAAIEPLPGAIKDVEVAIDHAKSRRRTWCWLVWVVVAIIAIVVIISVVVVKVVQK